MRGLRGVGICLVAYSGVWAAGAMDNQAAWDQFVPPPDAKYDWIQLNSGEWLKGEFKVLYNYTVEFDSDELDLQEFELYDVKRLRTHNGQRILIQEGASRRDTRVVTGKLYIDGDSVVLDPSEAGQQAFSRAQVVAISDRSIRERDNWAGELAIGVNLRSGNTDTTDTTIRANVKRRTPHSRLNIDYLSNYSKSADSTYADNQRLNGYFDRFLTRGLFWRVGSGEYYRDPFSNIRHQYSLASGLGYTLFHTSKTEFDVNTGVGYQEQRYDSVVSGEDEYSASIFGYGGVRLDHELTSSVDVLVDYSFRMLNDQSGRYTHHSIITLSADLIQDLDLDISMIWDRIGLPQQDADGHTPEQDDLQLVFGLSYDF